MSCSVAMIRTRIKSTLITRDDVSSSGIRDASTSASSGIMTIAATIMITFPISTVHDGPPRHKVSSVMDDGTALVDGALIPGDGRPQCGHAGASVETSRPQSGHAITGMERILIYAAR